MRLRELFEQSIDRNINGVVNVDQIDNVDLLEQELKEFVVTKELTRHFTTFYKNYNNSIDERTSKIGVWISGFFGSGKSHFLKMLSYLIENKEVKGKHAVEYFADKNLDDMTLSEMIDFSDIVKEDVYDAICKACKEAGSEGSVRYLLPA